MDSINVRTWYLEMTSPPDRKEIPIPHDLNIIHLHNPTLSYYQFLYSQVGKGFSWYNRLLMFADELKQIITHPKVEIYVLYVSGVPAGFCELDLRKDKEVEISYFGIMPEFRGKGLGKFMLDWILQQAWSYKPMRVWLHTCELDHKGAMRLYLDAGFTKFDERLEKQPIIQPEECV